LKQQNKLFDEFEKYRDEAKSILGLTNQASLVGALIQRDDALKYTQLL